MVSLKYGFLILRTFSLYATGKLIFSRDIEAKNDPLFYTSTPLFWKHLVKKALLKVYLHKIKHAMQF